VMAFPWRWNSQLTLGSFGPFFYRLPLRIPAQKAKSHWHIIGKSGSGKSFFLANLFLLLYQRGFPVTLIDPHGDLAKLVLSHLVAAGVYRDPHAFERIIFLDLPQAERQGLFMPFNVLKQDAPEDAIASNVKEAFHRAWPELAQGAATFDTLLPDSIMLLLHNHYPITSIHRLLVNEAFREQLLAHEQDVDLVASFRDVYDKLRKPDQVSYAGSVLRRARQLTQLQVLKYGLGQQDMALNFRRIIDQNQSVIVNLALHNPDARRLFGCFLTVGAEQGALSRSALAAHDRTNTHHLLIDEFSEFTAQGEEALTTMLSQTRKFGLFLVMAHQNWSQTSSRLRGAMQNVGVEVVFEVGREDAEYTARMIGRVDPKQIKHTIKDETLVDRTHPIFDSVGEQREGFTQHLQDLKPRSFMLKVRGKPVKQGQTLDVSEPRLAADELAMVQQEYFRRYFTPQPLIEQQLARYRDQEQCGDRAQDSNHMVFTRTITAREPLMN
jgi:hypothetical protein